MPSNVILANASIALAALAPTSTVAGTVHPAHAARVPRPARHVAHVTPPLAVTRLRAGRASGGQVTLTLA